MPVCVMLKLPYVRRQSIVFTIGPPVADGFKLIKAPKITAKSPRHGLGFTFSPHLLVNQDVKLA